MAKASRTRKSVGTPAKRSPARRVRETHEIEKRLAALGLKLPAPPRPRGSYVGCVRVGNLLYLAGNTGRLDGVHKYSGKVGDAVTLEQAYEMARHCALNHLAVMKAFLGSLDRVERVVKVNGYVNAAPGFTEMPRVTDGASDLLVELFGKRGEHARTTVGIAVLGANAPVELEMIVQTRP